MKVDISDFFPSVDEEMVEDILRRQLGASRQVARAGAALLTRHDESDVSRTFLPQGSPGSCIVANLVLDRVDRRIQERAQRLGVTYTRYLDDIAVSGDRARELISLIIGLLTREGFRVSRRKLEVVSRRKSQVVTGISVNRTLSPEPEFRDGCMALYREGCMASAERLLQVIATLRGKLAYARSLEGAFPARLASRLRLLEMRIQDLSLPGSAKDEELAP